MRTSESFVAKNSPGRVVFKILWTALLFALMSLFSMSGAREAYTPTYYGLPACWLERKEPNRPLAAQGARTAWVVYPLGLLVDVSFSGAAVLVAARVWRRRRERRRNELGLCVCCGYNLTGLTEPRCPECGAGFRVARSREP